MARIRRPGWPGLASGHTFRDTDLAGLPGAGYFRVSDNPDEETKSVNDQEAEYLGWVKRVGVKSGPDDRFKDDDRSASVFAKRQRENFTRLREAIEAERYKIIWFWSTSRQTRGDVNIYELAKASADHGVLWSVAGQLLNPANEDDLLILGINHLMDRQYSWRISKDVRRGKQSAAAAGRPAACAVYGYKRVYDAATRKFVRDEPNVFDGNGHAIEDSPAYVVREIFDRIGHGEAIAAIRRDLEQRRVRVPRPHTRKGAPGAEYRWSPKSIRDIATNPFYIGKRVYQVDRQAGSSHQSARLAAILDLSPDVRVWWEPLVTEEQFWAVQRILSDPSRARSRSRATGDRGHHLLTAIAHCAVCGSPLASHWLKSSGDRYLECKIRGCVAAREEWFDAYVEDVIVSWASREDVYTALWHQREDDSAVAAAARADTERLTVELEQARAKGEDPDEDPVFWSRRARAIATKLAEAEKLTRPASLSPLLAGVVGPDAADRWVALPVYAKRQIIAMVADIRLAKGTRGGYRRNGVTLKFDESRVQWRWLLGPDQLLVT